MFSLVISLLLLLGQHGCVEILPHTDGGLGALGAHAHENTVVMWLARPLTDETRLIETVRNHSFLQPLREALRVDGCTLGFSGLRDDESHLALTLHCAHLGNVAERERAPLPALVATRHFLHQRFQFKLLKLEYVVRGGVQPAYWSGNYETLDAALQSYFAERARSGAAYARERGAVQAAFTEENAPWGLDRIDMHYGLLDGEYHYETLASSVDIYVLDTGVRVSHQEFGGRATFLANTVGDGINTDCAGHGTMVASLAAGVTYGAAKGARVWAVKVLDCSGNGDTFTILTGAMAVSEHAAARRALGHRAVASLSLGGEASGTIDDAMRALLADGINVVVAAGNEHGDACSYSPSRLGLNTAVLTVGATTMQDARPAFSNQGACVSVSAPGVQIRGAGIASDSASVVLDGTSMATPFVSGVVALVLEQNGNLSVAQVTALIKAWATPGVVSGASAQGGGRNLLYSLIVPAQQPDLPPAPAEGAPPPPPGISFSGGRACRAHLALCTGFLALCVAWFL